MQGVVLVYDSKITLFNYHAGLWYTTIIDGVELVETKGDTATVSGGMTNADVVEAIIPASPDGSINSKPFVGPKEYKVCADPEGCFTITPESDFFVVGDHQTDPVSDDDYDEGLYHHLNSTMDNVYMITSKVFYSLLPHYEIGGR